EDVHGRRRDRDADVLLICGVAAKRPRCALARAPATLKRLPDEAFAPAVVDADRAAEQLALADHAEVTAVLAIAAMVADREDHAGRYFLVHQRWTAAVGEVQSRLARAEVLELIVAERLAVDREPAVHERHDVAADRDDPLDQPRAVLGRIEYGDLASLRRARAEQADLRE